MQYLEEYVHINKIEEYMVHYPGGKDAPCILLIHGRPGQSEALFAYHIEEKHCADYTIVYYDQRGTGKTYLKNRKAELNAQITGKVWTCLFDKQRINKNSF